MSSETDNSTCRSLEADRASEIYEAVAFTTLMVLALVVLSGAALWWRQRKTVWLQRRNPSIVWLLLVALVSVACSGPVYRISLNHPDKIYAQCSFVNFFFVLTTPCYIIPNTARIISFHYRLKFHQKLSKLHNSNNDVLSSIQETPRNLKNPVFFRAKVESSGMLESSTDAIDKEELKELKKLSFKAGSTFSFMFALLLLLFVLICAFLYIMATCKIFASDQSECEFGSTDGYTLVLLLAPMIPTLGLYGYFRKQLANSTPDPFGIKTEIDFFMWLVASGFMVTMLSFFDPGNFSKTGERSDEDISFKWVQLVDIMALLGFIHSIHWQAIKAQRFESSMQKVFPMSLKEILDHPDGCDLFKIFLQTDFSVENLVLYQLIHHWKAKYHNFESEEKRDRRAKECIYDRWIDTTQGIGTGVNISGLCVDKLKDALDQNDSFPISIFDEVLAELFSLMEQDSFIRFINTDEYKVFVGAKDPVNLSRLL